METLLSTDAFTVLTEPLHTHTPPNFRFREGKKGGATASIVPNFFAVKQISLDQYPSFEHHVFVLTALQFYASQYIDHQNFDLFLMRSFLSSWPQSIPA